MSDNTGLILTFGFIYLMAFVCAPIATIVASIFLGIPIIIVNVLK